MTLPRQLSEFAQCLTPEERRTFERRIHVFGLGKNEELFKHDAEGEDVFFVIEGRLDACLHSAGGREVLLRIAGPGDIIGEIASIDGGSRSATVIARTRSRLAQLPAADFKRIMDTCPLANMWLLRKVAFQIRTLTERFYEQVAFNVNDRIRAELLRLAAGAGVHDNKARILNMPTHRELANKIGTTREAVTREINDLQKRKLISKKRGRELIVLDCEGLALLLHPIVNPGNGPRGPQPRA